MDWITTRPFVSPPNFLGPLFDENGEPTGPVEYENLVKERYLISKRLHTSYTDTGDISVHERKLLLKYISDEINKEKEALSKQRNKH